MANAAKARIRQIPAAEAKKLVETGATLIDVRESEEYRQEHLEGAKHISRGVLEMKIDETVADKAQPIVCYCSGGNRGALAADTLQQMGYTNVFSVEGGLNAWKAANPKKPV